MSRAKVAVAHDYLTQRGGAERVVLSLLKAFPEATVYTTLYDPEGTYPEFADARIVTSPLNRLAPLRRHHRAALPLLAPAAGRLRIDADVTVASSSGWAHGFDMRGRRLIYCHTPARWLYLPADYLGADSRRTPAAAALAALRPGLVRWDQLAAGKADVYLANSRVVQRRIRDVYHRHAEVVPAPHSIDATGSDDPVSELEEWVAPRGPGFHLVVSRLMPYKNVDRVVEAFRVRAGDRLVVVGRGPEEQRLRRTLPPNVRLFGGLTDAQMRWLYRRARALVAPSFEDFGLTPLEAAAFGVPTVALRAGGYLDTVAEGVNGVFFDEASPQAISEALDRLAQDTWPREQIQRRAAQFDEAHFIERMQAEVEQLAEGC